MFGEAVTLVALMGLAISAIGVWLVLGGRRTAPPAEQGLAGNPTLEPAQA
jgi:hypothetical protein